MPNPGICILHVFSSIRMGTSDFPFILVKDTCKIHNTEGMVLKVVDFQCTFDKIRRISLNKANAVHSEAGCAST